MRATLAQIERFLALRPYLLSDEKRREEGKREKIEVYVYEKGLLEREAGA
jgi:hypothetical protein